MLRLQKVASLLLVVLMLFGSTKSSQLEIEAFQPAVVPIRAITTLTLQTSVNVTSNTSIQCRFKDISAPARIVNGFVFCDTPPMRNTDRVSVYLDIDGKLFKTKKPLYLHEPFKVANITPSVVSPAQNVHVTVSGITCKDWMQYFVRFQTANGTKKTQQGICRDSVVSCYVPEFPPNTRLRVGLTLSNRLVEWADRKILIQYPIDAMKSSVKDVNKDFAKKGTFTFVVVLRDRFRNFIKVIKRDNKEQARISVQYSPKDKPESMRFLECTTTLRGHGAGDEYVLSCAGAEKEHIYFYPSINNVPLGGQDKYEAITTLCSGKNSCEAPADSKSYVLIIVFSCVGVVLVLSVVVVFMFVRYKIAKKKGVAEEVTTELEMAVQLPKDVDRKENVVLLSMQYKYCINSALKTSDNKEGEAASPTHENVSGDEESGADSSEVHLGVSGSLGKCKQGRQGGGELGEENNERIEMKIQQFKHDSELSAAEDFKETAGPNVLFDTKPSPGDETLTMSEFSTTVEDAEQSVHTDG